MNWKFWRRKPKAADIADALAVMRQADPSQLGKIAREAANPEGWTKYEAGIREALSTIRQADPEQLKRVTEQAAFPPGTMEEFYWGRTVGGTEDDYLWRGLSDNWYQKDVVPSTYLEIHNQCYDAYYANPLAKCAIDLLTSMVMGRSLKVTAKAGATQKIIDKFWNDTDNHMETRTLALCRELALYGEQFIRFFVNPSTAKTMPPPSATSTPAGSSTNRKKPASSSKPPANSSLPQAVPNQPQLVNMLSKQQSASSSAPSSRMRLERSSSRSRPRLSTFSNIASSLTATAPSTHNPVFRLDGSTPASRLDSISTSASSARLRRRPSPSPRIAFAPRSVHRSIGCSLSSPSIRHSSTRCAAATSRKKNETILSPSPRTRFRRANASKARPPPSSSAAQRTRLLPPNSTTRLVMDSAPSPDSASGHRLRLGSLPSNRPTNRSHTARSIPASGLSDR